MFKQTRAWFRWLAAVIRWRYYRNMYSLKEWLAVNGILKFKRTYTLKDTERLGLLADLGRYTPLHRSAGDYHKLQVRCEKLERECIAQANLIERMREL